jgi:hypothetical protein
VAIIGFLALVIERAALELDEHISRFRSIPDKIRCRWLKRILRSLFGPGRNHNGNGNGGRRA